MIGAALFGLDVWVNGQQDDPRQIVIDDAKYAEIAGIYFDNQGRQPSQSEMAGLTVQWAQNEVLYREAKLMGLDNGDEMIRSRLILKLRNVLFNRVSERLPEEGDLETFFAEHRDRYVKPEFLDIELVSLAEIGELQSDLLPHGEATPDAWESRTLRRRPAPTLASIMAQEDVERLRAAPVGHWVAVDTDRGDHLARVLDRTPEVIYEFPDVEKRVLEDWKRVAVDEQLNFQLQAIAERYDIRFLLSKPPEAWDEDSIENQALELADASR